MVLQDFVIFMVLFSKKIRLLLKRTTLQKFFLIAKEELVGIDIEDIGNLEDLLKIVFIHEECGNLKVFLDDGEPTRNINKKKKPVVLQAYNRGLFKH